MANRSKSNGAQAQRRKPNGADDLFPSSVVMTRENLLRPYPERMRRTMRYSDVYYMTSTTGGTAAYTFRMNSMYDVDSTGTGHQPRFFDQLLTATGPYLAYRVLGAKVKMAATTVNDTFTMVVAGGFSQSSSPPTNASGSLSATCGSSLELPGWTGGLIQPHQPSLTRKWVTRVGDVLGVPPQTILTDDNYAGQYNSSPAIVAYFHLMATGTADNTAQLVFLLEFEFDVQLEAPVMVAFS